jgi:GxxExxY protein
MYEHDPLTERIIGCAMAVHRALGPGLLERTYEAALSIELTDCGVRFNRQMDAAVRYKGHIIGVYWPDLVVEDTVVIEIKAVERPHPVHQAQLLASMKALNKHVGLLINFNTPALRLGVRRLVL